MTVNWKSSSMTSFSMMDRARYSVPQNTPTPANMMMHAMRDANGTLPIFSVNAEMVKYGYKSEVNTHEILLFPLIWGSRDLHV